jgi:CRP/FNR family nitrogen fixation transcriptional regulator
MTLQIAANPSTFAQQNGSVASWPFPAIPAQPTMFFRGGSEIYGEGEDAGTVYQVEFGCVRIHRLMADGRRQIAAFHLPGEVFGFESGGTHLFFAEAVGATGIRISRQTAAIQASPGFLPLALRTLSRTQQHLLVLGRQNATERVAAFLLDIAERQGGLDHFDLPMSRGDIADYLGLTVETVSRTFTKFRSKGIIRLNGAREVQIGKWQALADMIE